MRFVRRCFKLGLWICATAVTLPLALLVRLLNLTGSDVMFQTASQLMSLFPGLPGDWMRQAFYWMVLDVPWPGPRICFGTTIAQRDTSFGAGVFVGSFCNLGRCHVGDRTLMGSGVYVASPRAHDYEDASRPIDDQGGNINKVMIGGDCWIGNSAVIMSSIANGVVVGAGSVVTKPCDEYGVYVGNPARKIKSREQSRSRA